MDFWRFAGLGSSPGVDGQFTPFLVLLSVVVATIAAYTALAVVNRIVVTQKPQSRRAWLALGATVMGCGIWAMHFIAMLAYQLPLPTEYRLGWTLASIGPAVLGSWLALHSMARDQISRPRLLLSGLFVAAGIGTMHYSGMEAIHVDARMIYDPLLFGVSIAVAFLLATLALIAQFALNTRQAGTGRRWGGALLMGGAVSGMHYTAMAAVHFMPNSEHTVGQTTSSLGVAIGVFLVVTVIIGLALLATVVERRLVEAVNVGVQSQGRHRTMLAAIPEGALTIGATGLVESSNLSAERMLGYAALDLAGKRLGDLFDLGETIAPAEVLRELAVRPTEVQARRQDGTTFPAHLRACMLAIGQESMVDLLVTDMTAARAADLERRQQAAALQQADDAIFITSRNGTIEYANPAFERITGFSRAEVLGKTPRILKSGHQGPDMYAELWETILRGDTWKGVLRNYRKDGSTFEVAQSVSSIRDESGLITHFVAVCRDVTEQKALEVQLRHAQKLEAVGRLAAGIAHEINTPVQYVGDNIRFLKTAFDDLSALVGALLDLHANEAREPKTAARQRADQVVEEADTEYLVAEIPRALEEALGGVNRVAHIVRAMKEFSHPGTSRELTDLNRLIETSIAVATNEWRYVAEVQTDFAPGLPPVSCFRGELAQVFLNLIVNSAQAIGARACPDAEKGLIRVSTAVEGHWAVVRIADNGGGIAENVRAHVFEPFFTTKEVGKGTGQGLALAHTVIVQSHGGAIEFETEAGHGTEFVIRLPLDESLASAASPGTEIGGGGRSGGLPRSSSSTTALPSRST